MRSGVLSLCLLAAGCGGAETEGTAFALRIQQMGCRVPALQANLQIQGMSERCPLTVKTETQTVEGRCPGVPTGRIVGLRLVYYVLLGENDPADLATISVDVDLRDIGSSAVVDFNQGELVKDYDDDMDGKTNLAEVCSGGDPRFREGT